MANVTPHATPAGGFPLKLTTQKRDGTVVSVTFPTSSAVDPADAAAEVEFKKMRVLTAGGTYAAAAS